MIGAIDVPANRVCSFEPLPQRQVERLANLGRAQLSILKRWYNTTGKYFARGQHPVIW
jgi:hypothetical protein